MSSTVVLLRHGDSVWTSAQRVAGWVDVPLADRGREQSRAVADELRSTSVQPSAIFASQLGRCADSAAIIRAAAFPDAVLQRDWQLNERYFGAWQGRRFADVRRELGAAEFAARHRSWDGRPPAGAGELYRPYEELDPHRYLINAESLADVARRAASFLEREVRPLVEADRDLVIVTHTDWILATRVLIGDIDFDELGDGDAGTASSCRYEAEVRDGTLRMGSGAALATGQFRSGDGGY
jgi:2,3-bisphosphoglycerate-dependent phosphoglycerate mutase